MQVEGVGPGGDDNHLLTWPEQVGVVISEQDGIGVQASPTLTYPRERAK